MSTSASKLESAVAKLRSGHLRHTPIRLRILEVVASAGRPATIGEIHKRIAPSCYLVTFYRNLDILEHAGAVRRFFRAKGTAIFDIDAGAPSIPVVSRFSDGVAHADAKSAAAVVAALEKAKDRLTAQGHKGVAHLVKFYVDSGPNEESESSRRRYGNRKAIN